jgi:hypothetical protein
MQPQSTTTQPDSARAAVGLGSMGLSTIVLHGFLKSEFWNQEQRPDDQQAGVILAAIFFFFALAVLWMISCDQWLNNIHPDLKNKSTFWGLALANLSLIYVLLGFSSPTLQVYVAHAFWPAYLGMLTPLMLYY